MRRVLAQGGWRETRLLRSRVGDAAIRAFLLASGARGLSPDRIRFWELVLHLPRRRADAWVRAARAGTWERRRRFSEDPIDEPLRLAAAIRAAGARIAVSRTEKGTLHGTVGGVRVSFLEYRYPLLRRPLDGGAGLHLASLEDTACMKLAAVAQRGSKKDFVDLYALGRRLPLPRMLRLYGTKYGVKDPGHLLFALSFFDDAETERMPTMLRPCSWEEVKRTIRSWVSRAAR